MRSGEIAASALVVLVVIPEGNPLSLSPPRPVISTEARSAQQRDRSICIENAANALTFV
jgi:hypothetical protein